MGWAGSAQLIHATSFAVGFSVSSVPTSSGPQNCAACVHEGLYEEGISILESSSVSTLYWAKQAKMNRKYLEILFSNIGNRMRSWELEVASWLFGREEGKVGKHGLAGP